MLSHQHEGALEECDALHPNGSNLSGQLLLFSHGDLWGIMVINNVINGDLWLFYGLWMISGEIITTSLSSRALESWLISEIMAQHFRLVNCYNLPRYMSPSASLKPFAQRLNGRSSEEFCEDV